VSSRGDPAAVEVHGLTNKFLSQFPPFSVKAPDLLAFINGATLVAHNAKFDRGFLEAEFERISGGGVPWRFLEQVIGFRVGMAGRRRLLWYPSDLKLPVGTALI
jgi:DNA polymerase III epsilon subunit-like protein